jgi:predicted DCC family thiol-disulfide oxidoreductase YuxK
VHSASGLTGGGWTGGQYSLCRGLLGFVVAGRVLSILVSPGHAGGTAPLGAVAVVAALLFAAGWRDRLMAVLLLLLLPVVIVLASIPVSAGGWAAAWLLLAHTLVPDAPFGSWSACGRIDPRGGWRMPPVLPWMHRLALLALVAALIARGGSGFDLGVLLVLGLLAFEPGWIPGRRDTRPGDEAPPPDTLFYDGTCGLCHASVRFLVAEDLEGTRFRFATLQGRTFRRALPEEKRGSLPDSIVLVTPHRRILTRAHAVRHALGALGGYWRVLATIGSAVPDVIADAIYDGVARVRHRLFRRPPEACPLIPPNLVTRFID